MFHTIVRLITPTALVASILIPTGHHATTQVVAAQDLVNCVGQVESPHFSAVQRGATVLFKTRMRCRGGPVTSVQFRVRGTLGFVSGGAPGRPAQGPPTIRASSEQVQTVLTNGSPVTFYTPLQGTTKVRGSGTYVGRIVGETISPASANSGPSYASSAYTYVQDPG